MAVELQLVLVGALIVYSMVSTNSIDYSFGAVEAKSASVAAISEEVRWNSSRKAVLVAVLELLQYHVIQKADQEVR